MHTDKDKPASQSQRESAGSNSRCPKPPRQLKMVGWYDPLQLCRTAIDVLISLIFGRHSDFRLIEALGAPDIQIHDYTKLGTNNEFWIDYTADVGDGWNSTYAIAYYIAQQHLDLKDPMGNAYDTQRGSILVLGGDEVYPVASRAQYRDRLVSPYMTALCETTDPHPHIYVIPGNHDWYDSLASYTRLFCSDRWFAGWQTQQARSYFALKLPYHWWMIGTDIQLDSDIDDTQVRFFKKVAEQMNDEDKIILCSAEPEWIYAKMYGQTDPEYSENNLAFLEKVLFKKKISIFLTGDLHHYTRHENPEGIQKIVAGGGGAFLHPTHGQDISTLSDGFVLKKNFPEESVSRKLCWRNFFFIFLNPYFGILTGLFYLLTVWSAKVDLGPYGLHQWNDALSTVINQALKSPIGMFWIVGVMVGFIAFTDTHSRIYRIIAGSLHSLSHLLAAFLLGWAAIHLSNHYGLKYDSISQLILSGLIVFAGGWAIGSLIMGIYLFISLNVFGRHSNEAFSSLHIQDWKNFLRIKINVNGEITIYPIGVQRVPRKWKLRDENASGPLMIPDDLKATYPQLIEKPIIVMRSKKIEGVKKMTQLSSPHDELLSHYPVIVIGSGYGGSIVASRLSRAGQRVCLLEKGKEFQVGEYPNNELEALNHLQIDGLSQFHGSRNGLYHLYFDKEISAFVGCGLGGTSLVNANVALRAEKRVFEDPRFPKALQADLSTLVEEGYRHAEEMLKPTPYPQDFPPLNKMKALEKSAQAIGQEFYRPPIAVNFIEGINHVGVVQHPCQLCGDCVSGCNYAAKNTLIMNYLPDAKNNGAAIFTEMNVLYLEKLGERFIIYYQDFSLNDENAAKQIRFITADLVILSGGTFGSTEILLRSKEKGLQVSDQVGEHFSGNGDVLAFGYNTKDPIDGIGFGSYSPQGRTPVGPCITGIIDMRHQPILEEGLVIEEGAIPGAASAFLPKIFALSAHFVGTRMDDANILTQDISELESMMRGPYYGALNHTQTFLVMSHDDSKGKLALENDTLQIRWPNVGNQPFFARINEILTDATRPLGGTYIPNPVWSEATLRTLITVHPLGGCVMADDATTGVVNHKGQVFSSTKGDDVYNNLYVCDGSIIPRSLGVNPLLTISALSERCAMLIAKDLSWTIEYALPSKAKTVKEPLTVGLEFTETMRGRLSTTILTNFDEAFKNEASTPFEFTLTIITHDLERMLADEKHSAKIIGQVTIPIISKMPLTVTQGEFQLFTDDPTNVDTRKMIYQLSLVSVEGKTYEFYGYKLIHNDPGFDIWSDTTTLYVTLYETTKERRLCGKGILKILPADFMHQLTTIRTLNTPNLNESVAAKAKFGQFFAGTIYQIYGGIFAKTSFFNPSAPPREKRKLRVDIPEVYFISTPDQQGLRLSRYRGGDKGPVILTHGLGVSSLIFSIDTIETNLLEYLFENGYDVWLLDYRASIDLPAANTSFSADEIAIYDYPAAVSKVLEITKAKDIQMVAHCFGATTLCMAMLAGLKGVRSILFSQIAANIVAPSSARIKAGLFLPSFLNKLGIRSLTAYADMSENWQQELFDTSLKFVSLAAEEQCQSAVCHRISFLYGQLYEHAQLNQMTHNYLHEMFGLANIKSFEHLALMVRKGHIVNSLGQESYMTHLERLALPITFIHGEQNQCFLPESTAITYELLKNMHGASLYERFVIPNYGHIDCIFGKNAVKDVYPLILHHLEAHAYTKDKTTVS